MTSEAQTTAPAGERWHVTVLFSDLCDYTALTEGIDPEEAEELLRELEALALRIVRKHGGAVTQVYGDGILAVFGYPVPQEDDARRAVEAALELHEAIRGAEWKARIPSDFSLRLHSAVHAGLVFAREGDALHGRYELTGAAVNTTARLCGAAARDEILVSDEVLRGIGAFFATESSGPLALKGKKVPIEAHRVVGRTDVVTRFEARSRAGLAAFVGRGAEIERLVSLAGGADPTARRVAVLSGAPGVGKTRILEELRRRVAGDDVRVLRGCCESYGEMAPLEPFLQTLRQLFALQSASCAEDAERLVREGLARLDDSLVPHAETYLRLLSLRVGQISTTGAEPEPLTAVDALSQLLLALGAHEPLVLVLDDWQWADDSSRMVLGQVLNAPDAERLFVVVGTRAEDRADPLLEGASAISLQPFDEDESATMIRMLRPRILDLGVARALHRRSGGNPLFLEELCRLLPDGILAGDRALEESGVPTTLQGLIQARVSALPPLHARVLRGASVIGNEFSRSLLSHVLPNDGVEDVLAALCGDLIHPTEVADTLRFKHGITRESIYESIRIAERRELHHAVATALEQRVAATTAADAYEALAYHYRGSGDHERAASYAGLAGDKAMGTSSLDRARAQYSTVLAELHKLPMTLERKRAWLATSLKWAAVYVYSPSRDQLQTLRTAAAYAVELDDALAQGYVAHWTSWIHYVLGEYTDAITAARAGLAFAERSGGGKLLVQLWATLGQCHAAAGQHAASYEWLVRSIGNKRQRARGGRTVAPGFAYALGCKACMHGDRGEFDAAEADLAEAFGEVSGSGHPVEGSVLALQCIVLLYRGRFDAAADSAQRSCEIAERVNSAYVFAIASGLRAYGRFMHEASGRALKEMIQAVEWLEARDTGLFISFNYGCLGEALAIAGDRDRAHDYASRALLRKQRGDGLGETLAYRALARIHHANARRATKKTQTFLERALSSAEMRGSPRDVAVTQLLAAELLGVNGVRGPLQDALATFERMDMAFHAAGARSLLAVPG